MAAATATANSVAACTSSPLWMRWLKSWAGVTFAPGSTREMDRTTSSTRSGSARTLSRPAKLPTSWALGEGR